MTCDMELLQHEEPELFAKPQVAFGHDGGASSQLSFSTVQLNYVLFFLRRLKEAVLAFHRPGGLSSYNDVEHVQGSITVAVSGKVIESAAFGPVTNSQQEQASRQLAHESLNAAINTGKFSGQPLKSYMYLQHFPRLSTQPLPGPLQQQQQQQQGAALSAAGQTDLEQQQMMQQLGAHAGAAAGAAAAAAARLPPSSLPPQHAHYMFRPQQQRSLPGAPCRYQDIEWSEPCSYEQLHAFCQVNKSEQSSNASSSGNTDRGASSSNNSRQQQQHQQAEKQQRLVTAGTLTVNLLKMLRYASWFLQTHGQAQYCSLQILRFGCQELWGSTCELCQSFGHRVAVEGCSECAAKRQGCGWDGLPMLQFIPQPYPNSWRYRQVCSDPSYQTAVAAGTAPDVQQPAELHYEPLATIWQEPYPDRWLAPSQVLNSWYKQHKDDNPPAPVIAALAQQCAPTSAEDVKRWFEEKQAHNFQREQREQEQQAAAAAAAQAAAAARQANPAGVAAAEAKQACEAFLKTLPGHLRLEAGANGQLCMKANLQSVLQLARLASDGPVVELTKRVVENKAAIWAAAEALRAQQQLLLGSVVTRAQQQADAQMPVQQQPEQRQQQQQYQQHLQQLQQVYFEQQQQQQQQAAAQVPGQQQFDQRQQQQQYQQHLQQLQQVYLQQQQQQAAAQVPGQQQFDQRQQQQQYQQHLQQLQQQHLQQQQQQQAVVYAPIRLVTPQQQLAWMQQQLWGAGVGLVALDGGI
jgi:hypothetical protein